MSPDARLQNAIVAPMSQERLAASLDIDRCSPIEIVRIIQEQDRLVAKAVAAATERITQAVEGAEDDEPAAIAAVDEHVTSGDALVGVAASGTTPYTLAAVRRAHELGALTGGVTSTPGAPLAREARIPIVADTGPEVIPGSTRMKSGTAQKLILNTLSTGVMIRLGRVYSNLMIEMPVTNEKLRNRAVRMVELAGGVPRPAAA